jgi:hypothetical protein
MVTVLRNCNAKRHQRWYGGTDGVASAHGEGARQARAED